MSVSKTSKLLQYINYRKCCGRRLGMLLSCLPPTLLIGSTLKAPWLLCAAKHRDSPLDAVATSLGCRHAGDRHGRPPDGGQVSSAAAVRMRLHCCMSCSCVLFPCFILHNLHAGSLAHGQLLTHPLPLTHLPSARRFMAFDRHMNLVLGDAEEFRKLPPKKGKSDDEVHTAILPAASSLQLPAACQSCAERVKCGNKELENIFERTPFNSAEAHFSHAYAAGGAAGAGAGAAARR